MIIIMRIRYVPFLVVSLSLVFARAEETMQEFSPKQSQPDTFVEQPARVTANTARSAYLGFLLKDGNRVTISDLRLRNVSASYTGRQAIAVEKDDVRLEIDVPTGCLTSYICKAHLTAKLDNPVAEDPKFVVVAACTSVS